MKHMLTNYGRIVIPKKGLTKNETLKTILEVQGIDMTEAEQQVVSKYLRGECTLEEVQAELMNLPEEE